MIQEDNIQIERRSNSVLEYQKVLLNLTEKIEQLSIKIDASHNATKNLQSELHLLRQEFDTHRTEETHRINSIMKAFPERDFDDHHDYHEQKRQSAKSWSEIILDIKKKVLGGVVWAFLLAIGLALWEYLKVEMRK